MLKPLGAKALVKPLEADEKSAEVSFCRRRLSSAPVRAE